MDGPYGRLVLPAVIFQSVLIGGGYATGREIVQFGGRLGPAGLWSILAAGLGFSLTAAVAFEYARTFRLYNYRAFMRHLIGGFWPLFDILFFVMVVIIIAVMASAAGELGRGILGVPYPVGVGGVILAVATFNFLGAGFIERAKSMGTLALYLGYVAFAGVVLLARWPQVVAVLTGEGSAAGAGIGLEGASSQGGKDFPAYEAVGIGVLYVAYNLTAIPAVLFALHRQERRADAVWAGVWTGILAIVPFLLTYLCLMGFYPDPEILGAEIPWLVMLERAGGSLLLYPFALVVGYTLVETAVGQTHALAHRVDDSLKELGRSGLSPGEGALFTGGIVALSALLSSFGIIALVARGYTAMAWAFLAVFAIPLLTRGVIQLALARDPEAQHRSKRPGLPGGS
ncbi:MAG: hypothetical protein WEA09_03380 [Gemmatimonadota bacterium]